MVIEDIRRELADLADPQFAQGAQLFSREPVRVLGIKTALVRKMSSRHWGDVKGRSKKEIFELSEELLKTQIIEEQCIGFDWAFRLRKRYAASDFRRLERWVRKYVTNWGSCDDLCTHALGAFLLDFPEALGKTVDWTASKNRWFRRAAAVCVIYSLRRREHLDWAFDVADRLLTDGDDLVQKGYGWMLKEASNAFPDQVYRFVLERKKRMPRTALRYAIEKLPASWKKRAIRR